MSNLAVKIAVLLLGLAVYASGAHAADPRVELEGIGFDVALDHDRSQLYVSVPALREVQIISMDTLAVIDRIAFLDRPKGIDLSIDGSRLFVALDGNGEVASVDLATLDTTIISIADLLGHESTYDVVEARPSRLVATANPGSGGFAWVVLVKLDEGNAASRIADQRIIRAAPNLLADRANRRVYIGEGFSPNSLYQLDLGTDGGPISLEDDHGTVSGTNHLALDATAGRIWTGSGQVLRVNSFRSAGRVGGGPVTLDSAAGRAYVGASRDEIQVYDSARYALTGGIEPDCGLASIDRLVASRDESILYVLGDDLICKVPTELDSVAAVPVTGLGGEGFDVEVDEARGLAYVSVPERNEIALISLATLTVVDRAWIGSRPYGIEIGHDGDTLYAALNGAGAVGVLDLRTLQASEVFVGDVLDSSNAYDVAEVKANELVVTADGWSRTTLVKLNQGNAASRIGGFRLSSARPVLLNDPGRDFLYVGEGHSPNSLYKLDLGVDGGPIVLEDDHGSVSGTDKMALNEQGNRIVLRSGQVLRSGSFIEETSVTAGIPQFSSDGQTLYMASSPSRSIPNTRSILHGYDANTFEPTRDLVSTCTFNNVVALAALPGSPNMLVLGDDKLCGAQAQPHPFFPLEPDYTWRYDVNGSAISSDSIDEGTILLNGKFTTALDSQDGLTKHYSNGDSVEWHRLHDPAALSHIPGGSAGTFTYSPAIPMARGVLEVSQTLDSAGTVLLEAPGLGSFTLAYESSAAVTAIENITVPAGSFETFKVALRLRQHGSIGGVPFEETSSFTLWLARDFGPVKISEVRADESVVIKELVHLFRFPDEDMDGIETSLDNCPMLRNPDQANFDRDEFGDLCDMDDDGDGLPDSYEVANGLNPLAWADAFLDQDDDGILTIGEYLHRTNPFDADTDGDGVNDGDELLAGTNPLVNVQTVVQIAVGLLLE